MNPRLRLVLHGDQSVSHGRAIDQSVLASFGLHRPRLGYVSSEADPNRCYFEYRYCYYKELDANLEIYVGPDATTTEDDWTKLLECDAIHLSGGNTFAFVRWLVDQEKLQLLHAFAERGGVLIGVSAGSILMTPSVRSEKLCGETGTSDLHAHALNLVPFHFWPHYLPGQEFLPKNISLLSHLGPTYACCDGAAVVVSNGKVCTYGNAQLLPACDA